MHRSRSEKYMCDAVKYTWRTFSSSQHESLMKVFDSKSPYQCEATQEPMLRQIRLVFMTIRYSYLRMHASKPIIN